MSKAPRASLTLSGLTKEKPHINPSSVGEAPMNPAEALASVETAAPEPVKEAEQAETPQQSQAVIILSQATAAKLPPQESIQPVVISAPVHPRQVTPGHSQVSFKLDGERLARFENAKHKTRLKGQQIIVEAIDIWLAHNGF